VVSENGLDDPDAQFYESYVCGAERNYGGYCNPQLDELTDRQSRELLAARGIIVSHETVRQWARKFGQQFANQIRRRLPRVGDKWHLDEDAGLVHGSP
jgi:hypothetical protein